MPKGRKRTEEEYERELIEAAKRMKKHPEHLKAARDSKTWRDFLLNVGVNFDAISSDRGSKFWEEVRKKIYYKLSRGEKYKEARQVGVPSKLARRVRDWSEKRLFDFIIEWQSKT